MLSRDEQDVVKTHKQNGHSDTHSTTVLPSHISTTPYYPNETPAFTEKVTIPQKRRPQLIPRKHQGQVFNHNGHLVHPRVQPDGESGRSWFHPVHFTKVAWRSSSPISQYMNVLWPFVPAGIVLHFIGPKHVSHNAIFAVNYIGMVPAANLIGFAGQELSRKLPKVLGILVETLLGSIVEIVLFIVLIVKSDNSGLAGDDANLIPVIQAAILGSILTNLHLCLGFCFFVGGLRRGEQTFHAVISEVGSGLLLVAGFALLIPSAFWSALNPTTRPTGYTMEKLNHDTLKISQGTAIILLAAFGLYIYFNAHSHHSVFDEILEADEQKDEDRHLDLVKPKFTFFECILALALALTFVTLIANFLVIEIPFIVRAGIPDQFLGLILLPLVEKFAEHLTAVDEAWDNQINFALFHCLGPSIQTALFNTPVVVLVGWGLGKPMDLNFEIFMIALLVLSILVVGNFLRDGASNYLEGGLLIIVYSIIALTTWYYPNAGESATTTQ